MPTPNKETHKQRVERETRSLLSEIVEAGGRVNVRFDKAGSVRLAIRFDRIEGTKATPLFIRYRQADQSLLLSAARDMLVNELGTAE